MNKKLFLGMFAAAGMLFATSCSNDELDQVQPSSDQAQVTFSLGLEGGMATRAISDGTKADKLVYAVYKLDANGENPVLQPIVNSDENKQIVKEQAFGNDLKETVTVTLAKGQSYQIAFWAQDDDCKAYNTDDLTKVGVSYMDENGTDNAKNNDESRDAFIGTVKFDVIGDKNIDVVLKRPFAQINVGVVEEDWNAALASGITIKNSSVVIKNVADEINLLTGAVTASNDMKNGITYDLNTIPTETLYVETDASKDGKEAYKWLSMSYILVADEGTQLVNGMLGANSATLQGLQYTFEPVSGNSIEFKEGLAGAPVQRNWRTNILGKILTGDVQFNITIDPVYDGDNVYPSNDRLVEQLKFAAAFGGTVTLSESVTLNEPLTVTADMILNMEENVELKGSINVSSGISLTVNGGKIINGDNTVSGIISNGNLVLNNVDITSARHALRIESGNAVINGGTYKVNPNSSKTLHAMNIGDHGTKAIVTIKNGTFIGPKGTNADSGSAINVYAGSEVAIEGGNFSKGKNSTISSKGTLTISGGVYDQAPNASYIVSGYKTVELNQLYYVVASEIDAIVKDADELKTAVADGKVNIYMLAGTYNIDNCGGKTFTLQGSKDVVINVVGGAQGEANGQLDYGLDGSTVTFKGVTIKTNGQTYAGYARLNATYIDCHFENCYCLNGTSSFENCTFSQSGNQYNVWTWGAPAATFTGCTFNSDGKAILLYGTVNTKLTVENCIFNDNGGLDVKKAAIEIGNDHNKSYELIVNNTIVNGFEINDEGFNTGTTLWGNKNKMTPDKLKVTVDGKNAYKFIVSDATLAALLNNATEGSIVELESNKDYGTISVYELKNVTIKGAENSVMIFKTDANTKIENVTLQNVKFEYTGTTADCGVVVDANAQIDNLVIDGCTFTGNGAKAGRGLSGLNNNASIEINGCTFKDLGYPIYAWGGYEELSIEGCTFDNIKSWAIMPQSGFDGDLTVTGCTFKNCLGGGLIKAGTLTAGHTFTFTNNTITDCTVAGDHNWFQFNVSAGASVISGNTKDGAAWTPSTADGLK